jgi:hypothetical protein
VILIGAQACEELAYEVLFNDGHVCRHYSVLWHENFLISVRVLLYIANDFHVTNSMKLRTT